jgi:hypothetical protein
MLQRFEATHQVKGPLLEGKIQHRPYRIGTETFIDVERMHVDSPGPQISMQKTVAYPHLEHIARLTLSHLISLMPVG